METGADSVANRIIKSKRSIFVIQFSLNTLSSKLPYHNYHYSLLIALISFL